MTETANEALLAEIKALRQEVRDLKAPGPQTTFTRSEFGAALAAADATERQRILRYAKVTDDPAPKRERPAGSMLRSEFNAIADLVEKARTARTTIIWDD